MCTEAGGGDGVARCSRKIPIICIFILSLSCSRTNAKWFQWGDVVSTSIPEAGWEFLVREGLEQHLKYMHGRGREFITNAARHNPSKQKDIVSILLDTATPLLVDGSGRDEVGARGCEQFYPKCSILY